MRMRPSRVANTQLAPLQEISLFSFPPTPSSADPSEHRSLVVLYSPSLRHAVCKYPASLLSTPSSNSYQNNNHNVYTSIPFVRSDGFLVRMFGQRDAAFFIESLLKTNAREVYLIGNVPGWHNALMVQRPSVSETPADAVANNNVPLWLLDFIPVPMYHVVPQKIWTPPNQSDWRRYVEQAHLRMPVFFVQGTGAIGLQLPRAVVGDTASLRGADGPAPLGGGHSTQIRIAWPGYETWERQIQIRDQTRHRNEITLERFAKLVAGVVDRFLTHASTTGAHEPNWRIGQGGINRNHVIIVGTVQVSAGGWMPILQISNPSAAPTPQGHGHGHYYA